LALRRRELCVVSTAAGRTGHELMLGDATAIRASNPRSQKTDKRDARHILRLLVEERFPVVWQPGVENERLRQLLLHRSSLVRMRTRIENQLDSVGKNEAWWKAGVDGQAAQRGRGAEAGWLVRGTAAGFAGAAGRVAGAD